MKKRSVKILSTFAALALLLAACRGGTPTDSSNGETTMPSTSGTSTDDTTDETTEDTTDGTTDDTTDPVTGDVVKITLMQSKTEIQSDLETVIADFNAADLGVEVTLLGTAGDNFATVLQSNFSADPASAPTVFTMSGVDSVNFEQFYATLDDTEAAKILSEGLKDEFLNEDGVLAGLPGSVEGYGFIYNVEMFEEADIDPTSLTDIPTFVSALETLATVDGVEAPIGFAEENYFIFIHFFNWAIALDDNYVEQIDAVNAGDQGLADIPTVQAWADALELIAPYTNKARATYDEQVAGFGAGHYAMIHQGNWAQQVLQENEVEFEYAFLPYPLDGNDGLAVGTASAWRVNNRATEEEQAAAKTFIDWLITSDEGQEHSANTLLFIPAYQNVLAPEGGLSQSVADYVSYNKTVDWAYNTVFPAGIDIDGAAYMQEFYAGLLSADELIEELTITWQDLAN